MNHEQLVIGVVVFWFLPALAITAGLWITTLKRPERKK